MFEAKRLEHVKAILIYSDSYKLYASFLMQKAYESFPINVLQQQQDLKSVLGNVSNWDKVENCLKEAKNLARNSSCCFAFKYNADENELSPMSSVFGETNGNSVEEWVTIQNRVKQELRG